MSVHTELHLTMGEAIDRLQPEKAPRTNDLASYNNSSSMEWDLNTNFSKAVKFAEFGWQEKIADVEAYLSQIQQLTNTAWTTNLDVAGESVDIGAYLEGEPECMLSYVVPEVKAVRIVASITARCTADAPRLLNRGIAIAAAVYALQCRGVPVSLVAAEWVSGSGGTHYTGVEINPFGDYIDTGRLAFWLGHPAALRRCFFRFQEQQPADIRDNFGFKSSRGYGTPIDPPKDAPAISDAVFIPFPETSDLNLYQTPDVAFKTVCEIFAKQGIDLAIRRE
jgi:hypothetical protein